MHLTDEGTIDGGFRLGLPTVVSVRSLGGRNLLFGEEEQVIYEVDAFTAFVADALQSGLSRDGIVSQLQATGISTAEAAACVSTRVELIRTKCPSFSLDGYLDRQVVLTMHAARVAVQLRLPPALEAEVRAVFGDLISPFAQPAVELCADMTPDGIRLSGPSSPALAYDRSEFMPVLKAELVRHALEHASYEVALHAAALARKGKAVLLVGSPGAGKSTLSLALSRRGFDVMTDDVVLLHGDGSITGINLPYTAKEGSWPLLARHWPDMLSGKVYHRSDGKAVRYIQLHSPKACEPRRIGRVVLLDRSERDRTELTPIDPLVALEALLAEGATNNDRLTKAGFTALTHVLGDAPCYRLSYRDFVEAAAALDELQA